MPSLNHLQNKNIIWIWNARPTRYINGSKTGLSVKPHSKKYIKLSKNSTNFFQLQWNYSVDVSHGFEFKKMTFFRRLRASDWVKNSRDSWWLGHRTKKLGLAEKYKSLPCQIPLVQLHHRHPARSDVESQQITYPDFTQNWSKTMKL